MSRSLATLLLCCCATMAHAASPARPCEAAESLPARLARDEHGSPLKLDKCWRYADSTGDYRLVLLHSADRPYGDDTLSSSLAAQLFKRQPDGRFVAQWTLHDRAEEDEAGAAFANRLVEFADLAGDGTITPILVLRFWPFEEPDKPTAPDYSPFAGRLKLILFRGNTKVAVRAVTGMLDDERVTTATDSFFDLPPGAQRHLADKIARLHRDEIFVADDSRHYAPRREKKP